MWEAGVANGRRRNRAIMACYVRSGGQGCWLLAAAHSSKTASTFVVRRMTCERGARAYQSDPCWRDIIARMHLLSSQVFIRLLSGIGFTQARGLEGRPAGARPSKNPIFRACGATKSPRTGEKTICEE